MLRILTGRRGAGLAVLAAVVLVTVLAACSENSNDSLPKPKPGFCEAAQHYDHRVERGASIDEQITILTKLARNAPKDVASDANRFLESMRAFRSGTEAERKALQQDPKVKQAVENVNRRAADGCGFYDQQAGSGI